MNQLRTIGWAISAGLEILSDGQPLDLDGVGRAIIDAGSAEVCKMRTACWR